VKHVLSRTKETPKGRSRNSRRSPFHTCGKSGDAPGYALRFPRVLRGVRVDKSATDATTQREIIQMYKQQRKT